MMLSIIRSIEGWTVVARSQRSGLGGGLPRLWQESPFGDSALNTSLGDGSGHPK